MLLPYLNENLIEAGCDEAGRGCLAGAVYAAAVILPKDFKNELLNDSKQLTEKQRYALREVIEKEAIAWAVGIVSPEEIDEINILGFFSGDASCSGSVDHPSPTFTDRW
jgi:ribonuclease HII